MKKAGYTTFIAAIVGLWALSPAPSVAAPIAKAPAGYAESAGAVQPIHWRRWRHCHWRHGWRHCHGRRYYRRHYGYAPYYYRPGIYLRFGRGHRRGRRW